MRFKDSTLEQRLFSLALAGGLLFFEELSLGKLREKFLNLCEVVDARPIAEELTFMHIYMAVAAIGVGFMCMHFWPEKPGAGGTLDSGTKQDGNPNRPPPR